VLGVFECSDGLGRCKRRFSRSALTAFEFALLPFGVSLGPSLGAARFSGLFGLRRRCRTRGRRLRFARTGAGARFPRAERFVNALFVTRQLFGARFEHQAGVDIDQDAFCWLCMTRQDHSVCRKKCCCSCGEAHRRRRVLIFFHHAARTDYHG
jgi:hypothetical protein